VCGGVPEKILAFIREPPNPGGGQVGHSEDLRTAGPAGGRGRAEAGGWYLRQCRREQTAQAVLGQE
jgi:hypothetical protein